MNGCLKFTSSALENGDKYKLQRTLTLLFHFQCLDIQVVDDSECKIVIQNNSKQNLKKAQNTQSCLAEKLITCSFNYTYLSIHGSFVFSLSESTFKCDGVWKCLRKKCFMVVGLELSEILRGKKISPLGILVILQNWGVKRTTEDLGRSSGLLSLSPLRICLCLTFSLLSVDRPASSQHGHVSCKGKTCVHSCYYRVETCCLFQENRLRDCAGHQNKCKVLQSISLSKHSSQLISQKQGKKWSANIVSTSQMYLLLVTALWLANSVAIALSQTLFVLISFSLR